MAIDVPEELEKANARLPVTVDREMPLDVTIRTIALSVAQRHMADTTVRDGALYQQYKIEGRNLRPLTTSAVIEAALVFERYLWGEWSKGIAENAINAVATDAADAIEKMVRDLESKDQDGSARVGE